MLTDSGYNHMRSGLLVLAIFLSSCEFFKPKETVVESPIARISDKFLYPHDLNGLFPKSISSEDSSKLADKYVEDWIKKQLMILRSSQEIDFNEAEMERKVLDYRYALMVHSFQKRHIQQHLDTDVTEEEIQAYYDEKSDNFLLKQNIIKCLYVQLAKNSPNVNDFRKHFQSYPEANIEDVQSYVRQFAIRSYMEDTTWVIFDEVALGTPLENLPNKTQFLQKNRFSETSDDDYIYFLKIFDFKITDEISPLEFIRDDIENIIINKRKISLKKQLEEKIYEEARGNGTFEIYSR